MEYKVRAAKKYAGKNSCVSPSSNINNITLKSFSLAAATSVLVGFSIAILS